MTTRAVIDDILAAAVCAPSSHNTQPWSFAVQDDQVVELVADRSHALPVNDPQDRELVISCGAALLNLRVAAEEHGLRADVLCGPSGDLLARDRLTRVGEHDTGRLAAAIRARHTHRGPFTDRPLPPGLGEDLRAAAAQEEIGLVVVDPGPVREGLADLVDEGDRQQFADPSWRRELASWLKPATAGDGLPVARVAGAVTRLAVTRLDLGRSTGVKDAGLVREAPLVAVLWTAADAPADWLATGQGLERVLLTAAGRGVMAGFANQPWQVCSLRPQLTRLLGLTGHPQAVVRLGYPAGRQIQDFHHIRRAQSA